MLDLIPTLVTLTIEAGAVPLVVTALWFVIADPWDTR